MTGVERLDLRLVATSLVNGRCEARVEGHFTQSSLPLIRKRLELNLMDGSPMPTEYRVIPEKFVAQAWQSIDGRFEATLEAIHTGPGTNLPSPPKIVTLPSPGIVLGVPDAGLLADTSGIFATDWPTAVTQMQSDPSVGDWLAAHPDARIWKAYHANGSPDSSTVDEWVIDYWDDADGSGLAVLVRRQHALVDVLPDTYLVTNRVTDDGRPSVEKMQVISLRSFAAAYRAMTGTEPEVLSCTFSEDQCGIGRHVDMNWPYAGESGGSVSLGGLVVQVGTGIVFQKVVLGEPILQ